MRSTAFTIVLLVAFSATLACGGGRQSRPGTAIPPTVLEVDNQSFSDMTIYMVSGGQRIRLGRAGGKAKTALTIHRGLLNTARDVQFLADPLGSQRVSVTERIWMVPGESVSMIILP